MKHPVQIHLIELGVQPHRVSFLLRQVHKPAGSELAPESVQVKLLNLGLVIGERSRQIKLGTQQALVFELIGPHPQPHPKIF